MTQITCGMLRRSTAPGTHYEGEIHLGERLRGKLTLRPHPDAGRLDKIPDYIVGYQPTNGLPRDAGAAWIKHSDRASDFISVSLDDPDWPAALNLTAFADRDGKGSFSIVWSRPRPPRGPSGEQPEQHA